MAGLGWMYGRDLPLLSLTFARDLTARELLDRMGAIPATVAVRSREDFDEDFGDVLYNSDAYVVSAGKYGPWAWAWEHGSWRCVEDGQLVSAVSTGTAALALHANEPRVEFLYAEDRRLISGMFSLRSLRPANRIGDDPQRFDPELRALGAHLDRDDPGPLGTRGLFFRLIEGLGAGIPHADLVTDPVLSARLLVLR
ncbi:DUF6461 domain-containing protein [Streptomyces sp. R21]|uniref:DUF6461 domain-containing protein n=1 Tax=Streptomyces sp. R21 TaxID=3238627 RepID=A0AB39PN82_9ACTN